MHTPAITLYGIPSCDSVRKARALLSTHSVPYVFHDFRKQGLDATTLHHWLQHVDWQRLLNRRGNSWRQLTDQERQQVTDSASAAACMLQQPTLVKRPVVDWGSRVAPLPRISVGLDGLSEALALYREAPQH